MSRSEEDRLFSLWTEAELRLVAEPSFDPADWRRAAQEAEAGGWSHDPANRRWVPFLDGIDAPSRDPWWTLRPMKEPSGSKGVPLQRRYHLQVLHPETASPEILQENLLHRWYGAVPRTVFVRSPNGSSVRGLTEIRGDPEAADLTLLDFSGSAQEVWVDPFVPAYPLFLDRKLVLLTPAQLLQLAPDGLQTLHSFHELLRRVTAVFGAALCAEGVRLPRLPPKEVPDFGVVITEPAARFAHLCSHGWFSLETQALVAAVLDVVRPRRILELGAWFGQSTCFMLRRAPQAQVLSVDFFKNAAIYDKPLRKVSPIDKLFLLNPRWECFAANVVAAGGAGRVTAWRGEIHAAVRESPTGFDVVFVDCEKNTQRLLSLLRLLRKRNPEAVIVGDDAVFASVRAAFRRLAPKRGVLTSHAYAWAPEAWTEATMDKLRAALEQVRREFAPSPATTAAVAALARDDAEGALDAARAAGVSPLRLPIPEDPRQTLACVLAARREALEPLFAGAEGWTAPIQNSLGCTPYDYATHKVSSFS